MPWSIGVGEEEKGQEGDDHTVDSRWKERFGKYKKKFSMGYDKT